MTAFPTLDAFVVFVKSIKGRDQNKCILTFQRHCICVLITKGSLSIQTLFTVGRHHNHINTQSHLGAVNSLPLAQPLLSRKFSEKHILLSVSLGSSTSECCVEEICE